MPDAGVRDAIDALIAIGRAAEAGSRLRQLWRESPHLGFAGFLRSRCLDLPTQFPVLAHGRLAILRSVTVEPLVPLLRAEALLWGVDVEDVWIGGYGSYHTELRGGSDALEAFRPDLVLLWPTGADDNEILRESLRAFHTRHRASVVVHDVLGAAVDGVYAFPYRELVARYGIDAWVDPAKLAAHGLPVRSVMHPRLVREWLKFLLPLFGRQSKVIVTDADNVLWHGVVGEDGPEGIRPNAPLQQKLRRLRDQGFLLALCSRNNAADVEPLLTGSGGMILTREDFVALRVNWNDKAANLLEIAAELNVDIESMVLLDDSRFERERIRFALPMATVVDLPPSPERYAAALDDVPTLKRLVVSDEDRARTRHYTDEKRRSAAHATRGSVAEYLHLLELQVTTQPVDPRTSTRAAQLTWKTNQFNLTTRRYEEAEILARSVDPAWHVQVFGASDRFGDYGLVGLVMARVGEAQLDIDTLLLSCRAMNRGIEQAMLAALVDASGVDRIVGHYVATARNVPCADFLTGNGFVRDPLDGSRWVLETKASLPLTPAWIDLRAGSPLPIRPPSRNDHADREYLTAP